MIQKSQTYHNPDYLEKKKKRLIQHVSFWCVVLVILIAGFAGLTHWSKVSIDMVQVTGTVILSPDQIKQSVSQYISGNYIYVLSKKNALLYPRKGLTIFLQQQFPRIQTVSVSLVNYHTIGVTVTERQPSALWCNLSPEQIASSTDPTIAPQCYFLDKTGFVFSQAPDFSGDAYFKYYGLVPFESAIGSSYLSSSDTFGQLSQFVEAVKALNITPLYIVATTQDDFEMYLYGGGYIIFDAKSPLAETASNLQKLLQTANLVPEKDGELLVDYIDLRYGNKVYYKVR